MSGGMIVRCECGKLHIWGQSCSCGAPTADAQAATASERGVS